MGIIADTMAEVVERTQSDPAGALTDLRMATSVEFLADITGKVWVNVDGVTALRVNHATGIAVDTSAWVGQDSKVIKP